MKVHQSKLEFQPITIVLETPQEADAFRALVDSEECDEARRLAISLSDLFTDCSLECTNQGKAETTNHLFIEK